MPPLYAGAARVKLDPPAGLAMLGYGNRAGLNAGIHDDLAAQALGLSDGANKIAISQAEIQYRLRRRPRNPRMGRWHFT